jgi:hypothetical protein
MQSSDETAPARGAIKFTDYELKKLPPPTAGRKDYLKFDSEEHGLAIRVGHGATASCAQMVCERAQRDG